MPESIALTAIWSVIPFAIGPPASASEALGLWVVISLLDDRIGGVAGRVASGDARVPRIPRQYGDRNARARQRTAARDGRGLLLMLSCLRRGHTLAVIRAGEIALVEHDDTMRLLLRDFADQRADWLWEIGAARPIVRASLRLYHAVGPDQMHSTGCRSSRFRPDRRRTRAIFRPSAAGRRSTPDRMRPLR